MSTKLVIVESPTKAKTIGKFLDKNYRVESSFGHIRDLPKSKMGIDIPNNFEPQYIIPRSKQKQVTLLKKAASKAAEIILASDEDREGEAIAWHLTYALDLPKNKYQRIVFHEITKEAILNALKTPRAINQDLVDAQQARRVLDRLVGYELSPFLWKKVAKGLSAGRVQSVAVRLTVEREREIQNFKKEEYWSIAGEFATAKKEKITAALYRLAGKKIGKMDIGSETEATQIKKELEKGDYKIAEVIKKETKKSPLPPFTTSTLQQAANHRLGYSAKQTMMLAQQLYEGVELGSEGAIGLITYMRTDSVNLSEKFLKDSQDYIKNNLGAEYGRSKARFFKKQSKLAQEAHEAIRPTDVNRHPEAIKNFLDPRQYKLYKLIWQRALASQMAEAIIDNTIIDIVDSQKDIFRAKGSIIKFAGFLKIYPLQTEENVLPPIDTEEKVNLLKIIPAQHFTEPPARYSDATLVKTLEEYGIGRPSTYAPTISTIIDRGYVERDENRRLKPKDIAFLVIDLLIKHFSQIVDYKFTAKMEDELDAIANDKKEWQPMIKEFYGPFKENLDKKYEEVSKKEITEEPTDKVCAKCGSPMVIKTGRFGRFLACSNYPACKNTKNIGTDNKPEEEITDELCAKCGSPMVIKRGRFGKFLGCSKYPECKNIKSLAKETGVKCPECNEGDIVERKSKRGRLFYSCNRYPQCKFALWQKPTGEKCPECQHLLVYGAKKKIICSNKECHYSKEAA
ncbi:MAG: type I DNA topoisomerase [Patescibacteria group bacterium]|nr:type I DNA topoisomerase [Patescibacteria group bacterium]MDD5490230.1 type I DNA topoisomerase [Patescibacteria group bacterium]